MENLLNSSSKHLFPKAREFFCLFAALLYYSYSYILLPVCRRVAVSAVQPADEDATTRQHIAQAYCGNVREGGIHAHNHH